MVVSARTTTTQLHCNACSTSCQHRGCKIWPIDTFLTETTKKRNIASPEQEDQDAKGQDDDVSDDEGDADSKIRYLKVVTQSIHAMKESKKWENRPSVTCSELKTQPARVRVVADILRVVADILRVVADILSVVTAVVGTPARRCKPVRYPCSLADRRIDPHGMHQRTLVQLQVV